MIPQRLRPRQRVHDVRKAPAREPQLTLAGSFDTLPAMSANRTIALIGVLLAAALLAAAGPAMAHPSAPIVAPVPPTPEAAIPSEAPPPAPVVTTSADLTPGLTPWIAAGALVLTGVALRRRPRRILVLCLVLLLTLFAFENALHSVHHGLDPKQADACAIATASAHLSRGRGRCDRRDLDRPRRRRARRRARPVDAARPLARSRPGPGPSRSRRLANPKLVPRRAGSRRRAGPEVFVLSLCARGEYSIGRAVAVSRSADRGVVPAPRGAGDRPRRRAALGVRRDPPTRRAGAAGHAPRPGGATARGAPAATRAARARPAPAAPRSPATTGNRSGREDGGAAIVDRARRPGRAAPRSGAGQQRHPGRPGGVVRRIR